MIPQLTPSQLQQLLQQWEAENTAYILLDVREDEEVTLASLPNHTHIPMHLIPLRHNELPDDQPIIVYCHHGLRSQQVAMYLADAGFDNLYNLKGGIDAWSQTVDPSIPRY